MTDAGEVSPTVLIATDLDRTLIYSPAVAGNTDGLVCVEHYEGRPASFMSQAAADSLQRLTDLVAVSTRTQAQLARVRLPGPPRRYAVAANGGVLLVDGEPDATWTRSVRRRLAGVASTQQLASRLRQDCERGFVSRFAVADELFCYAVVDRDAAEFTDFLAETSAYAQANGWRTSVQGRKVYWVPEGLTKAAAVAELAQRLDAVEVLAAGDSLLDIDLLLSADRGIRPAHGELHAAGWSAPHVVTTRTSGVRAGEEIAAWFVAEAEPSPGCPPALRHTSE